MRFFIDGTEWNFPHLDSLSREELLDALRERVASEDRVIVDMLCDGESLDEKDLLSVPDAIDVEVHTATEWGVGLEILDEIKNSLLTIFQELQSLLDDTEPFSDYKLDEIYMQLDWIREVTEAFSDAYPEYEGELPDVASLAEEIAVFGRLLTDGRYAQAHAWHEQDWKKEALPPVLDRLDAFKKWLEGENKKEFGDIEAGEEEKWV